MVIESEVPAQVIANVTRLCRATTLEVKYGQVAPKDTPKTGWEYAISDYPEFSAEISALKDVLTDPCNSKPAIINLLRDRCGLLEIKDPGARGLLTPIIISRCGDVGKGNQGDLLKAQKDLVLEEIILSEGQDPTMVTVEQIVHAVLRGSLTLSRSLEI